MATLAPRLTAAKPIQHEVSSCCGTMLFKRPDRIKRTGWFKPTSRTQPWTEQQAIGFHKVDEQCLDHGANLLSMPDAFEKSWFNSTPTADFNASDVALTNRVLSNPERRRTT